MTIREAIFAAFGWLVRHPKSITGALPSPITRAGIRSTYNSQNSVTTFDADLMTEMRTLDASYLAYTDTVLQGMIDSEVGENDIISDEFNSAIGSSGGGGN